MSWVLVLLTIEAVARRRLFQFLLVVVVVNVAVSVILSVAGLVFFFGWPTTVSALLGILALLLLLANLIELVRH